MSYNTREDYIQELKATLEEWEAKIQELEANAMEAKDGAREQYLRRIDAIKRKRNEVAQELDELQAAGGQVSESVKSGIKRLSDDVRRTWRDIENALR